MSYADMAATKQRSGVESLRLLSYISLVWLDVADAQVLFWTFMSTSLNVVEGCRFALFGCFEPTLEPSAKLALRRAISC